MLMRHAISKYTSYPYLKPANSPFPGGQVAKTSIPQSGGLIDNSCTENCKRLHSKANRAFGSASLNQRSDHRSGPVAQTCCTSCNHYDTKTESATWRVRDFEAGMTGGALLAAKHTPLPTFGIHIKLGSPLLGIGNIYI